MPDLYTQSTISGGVSNWNWNAANDNYAEPFQPTATGIPTSVDIDVASIVGTVTCEMYIRNQDTASGATTYASATGINLTAGVNTIPFAGGGSSITSGNTYYFWFVRTSSDTNYPRFNGDYSGGAHSYRRSTASNSDPTTVWTTFSHKMTIKSGTAYTQTCNETVIIAATIANLTGKVANETITIVASLARSMTRSLSEVVTIVTASNAALIVTRSFDEIITVVDTVASRISAKVFSEVITISETLSKLVAYARSYSETVTVTAAEAIQKSLARAYSETITIVASITNIKALGRVFNEVITITQRFQGLINGLDISWTRKYSNQAGTWLGKYSSQAGTWIKKYFDIP